MESIISTFHIDWKIIIAQAINFTIVFIVLYIYALKPLSKLMAERSEKISKGVHDAKTNAELLSKTHKEYEDMLAKARVEAQNIYQAGKKETEVEKAKMIENAKLEVSTIIAAGKKSLENDKVKMVEDARKEIVELTMKATEKLLASKADAHSDRKAVKELDTI